ncbi:8506_t:CDS:2, partial [Racocetra persica]
NLTLEKVKKLIFNSGLSEYLTNGKIKDLKDYYLGVEVGLGTHGKKNIGGGIMEKAIETLLKKYQVEYQKQVPVNFQVNGKKVFDFQIKLESKEYYLETSFFNTTGSKVQEVIRSYSGTVLEKAQNNEIRYQKEEIKVEYTVKFGNPEKDRIIADICVFKGDLVYIVGEYYDEKFSEKENLSFQLFPNNSHQENLARIKSLYQKAKLYYSAGSSIDFDKELILSDTIVINLVKYLQEYSFILNSQKTPTSI